MGGVETKSFLGVPVLEVGTYYPASGPSPWVVTVETIASLARTYLSTGSLRWPIKLGHNGSQELLVREGLPNAGLMSGVKASADGRVLLVDMLDVPAKIASLIEARAYNGRSIEAVVVAGFADAKGATHEYALTGLALLGEDLPAINSLDDALAQYAAGSAAAPRAFAVAMSRAGTDRLLTLAGHGSARTRGDTEMDDATLTERIRASIAKLFSGNAEPTAGNDAALTAARAENVGQAATIKAQAATIEAGAVKAKADAAAAVEVEAVAAVEAQILAGRITPAMKDSALKLARADAVAFAAFASAIKASGPRPGGAPLGGAGADVLGEMPTPSAIAAARASYGLRTDEAAVTKIRELKAAAAATTGV